ncbi:hypothetical protein [Jannaschia sp. R86511]|uniref:hypothetical protein n=1 Tax=Jannaschia sp. R86511 TaxID=3093853 RepID=UPI0036D3BE46
MSLKKVALLASAALAASSVILVVQPASGALTTRCTGVAGAVSVPGNLVVPRNGPGGQPASCTLEGTTVLGNVTVQAGADLLLEGADIRGNLIVQNDGYADVIADSSIGGAVQGRSQFGVFVEESSVAGGIDQRNPQENEFAPFVYTFDADVDGGVVARAGELLLESSVVDGDVTSVDGEYTDIVDTVINDRLTVRNNALGSVVCESEIYGNALYTGNGSTLQIGGSGETGPCVGASFWGGDVTFNDNSADVTGFVLANNIVRGDLAGSGNDPAATIGEGNRVRGELTLETAPAMSMSRMMVQEEASVEVAADRSDELQAKIAERRASAEKASAKTPKSKALS